MTENKDTIPQSAHTGYASLLSGFQSIQLGTVSTSGTPEASYAPAVLTESRDFYVHVSELSAHTANLRDTQKASVLLIEDEETCEQIFARKRVTYACTTAEVERDSAEWKDAMERFSEKFGGIMNHLKGMQDFHLIRLSPKSGRLVVGFGQAYDISGEQMETLSHVRGFNGKGHRNEPATAHAK
ncbi:pyridoxamine 5'-phosphate oxidase family protein [Coraliomargarita algicola]|uniref:Pyridoxamine 5'-phosphate oxidase family protein n=1 Tax=Coraliomargarita algicola TaxID=3092156 RepID=A0ABZ0RPX5_9BACT|nr:pyridoxamine 5'-phosphate oxidase family protein [Coraliomargarita sp. J2-16]WPJ97572.1 pyridoxamine 5'-phosphate oxidase family protein [Coraliomargarita sp. J2-16]